MAGVSQPARGSHQAKEEPQLTASMGYPGYCERAGHEAHGWGRLLTAYCYNKTSSCPPQIFLTQGSADHQFLLPFLAQEDYIFLKTSV